MGSKNRRPSHNHSHRVNRSVKRSHQNQRPFQSETPRESIQGSQVSSVQPPANMMRQPPKSALERTVNRFRIIVATPFLFFTLALLAPHEVIPTFQELFDVHFKEGTLPL